MRRTWYRRLAAALVLSLVWTAGTLAADTAPDNPRKHTALGLYLTAAQAYARWQAHPQKIHILDVRTQAEYIFVGHAPMARNIPVRLLDSDATAREKRVRLSPNPDFVRIVGKYYRPDDLVLVMCRSGSRSALAVNLLARAGYKNVYNIVDGFEGDAVRDPQSYFRGKRMKNGWKNAGVPWTYHLDGALMYAP